MKMRHHSDDEHDEPHSEGWLVSYADMMTLLFGLFVLLYSLAIENQGQMNQTLAEISTSVSNKKEEPSQAPPPVPQEDLKKVIEKQDRQLSELQKEIEKIKEQKAALDLEVSSSKIKNIELTDELSNLKKLKEEIESLTFKNNKKESEDKEKQNDNLRKEQLLTAQISSYEKQNKTLLNDMELLKKSQKDFETTIKKITNEKNDIEKKLAENLQKNKREPAQNQDKTIIADLQKTIEQKNQQLQQTQNQLKELQEENKNTPKFLMFVLKWFTDRHDLDLIVYDSKGKKFDFKKREYAGYPGRLALDSRSGPGAEIWQTTEFMPGEYRMVVNFYQEYNNTANAKFVIEVSSAKTTLATQQTEIKFSEKSKEFKFKVSEKGAVTLL